MLKAVLISLLVGLLAGGLTYLVLIIISRWIKNKEPGTSASSSGGGKNEPEKEKEIPRADPGNQLRIAPQSVWRGGSR